MYQLVRNGLAHTYMAKQVITVTKHYDGRHLSRLGQDEICVDALWLAEDLEIAYTKRVKPLASGSRRGLMQQQLDTIRKQYLKDAKDLSHVIANIPIRKWTAGEHVTQINSPSANASYSTKS